MEEAYLYLKNKSGLRYRDTVCLGVSGGPDSMALLHMILELKKELDLIVVVAHVNHNVREESDAEQNYIKDFCKEKSLIFETIKIDTWSDDNFENEARTVRYNFFDKVCKEHNAKYLMTAHHGDDLIETVLMRIVRGSSLKGYSGFSKEIIKDDYIIIRPFITVSKNDLILYCKNNNIKYFIDKTNSEDAHTRNRYRKYILPFLKEEEPMVHSKFLKFSETLLEVNAYIDKEVNLVINKVFKNGILDVDKLIELDHIIQVKIINNILEKIYGDDLFIITNTHVNLIFQLINNERPNSKVHLPNNVKAIKAYNELYFEFDDQVTDLYEVEINDIVNLPNGMNLEIISENNNYSNYTLHINSKEVLLPLYVRTRRNGDKIEVKGMNGHKKVNDIFIDSKIKSKDRDTWPIVCDANDNILWIPGLKKSKFDNEKDKKCDIIIKYY